MERIAEIQVSYRPELVSEKVINCSRDCFEFVFDLYPEEQISLREFFFTLYLNRRGQVLGYVHTSIGGSAGTLVDRKHVVGIALKANANAIILSHNHPSGNLSPSRNDKALTRSVKDGAELFGVSLLDHIIVTPDGGYFSFADEGIV